MWLCPLNNLMHMPHPCPGPPLRGFPLPGGLGACVAGPIRVTLALNGKSLCKNLTGSYGVILKMNYPKGSNNLPQMRPRAPSQLYSYPPLYECTLIPPFPLSFIFLCRPCFLSALRWPVGALACSSLRLPNAAPQITEG